LFSSSHLQGIIETPLTIQISAEILEKVGKKRIRKLMKHPFSSGTAIAVRRGTRADRSVWTAKG
jgi:hypothetical protein